jgi:hypothetical protein
LLLLKDTPNNIDEASPDLHQLPARSQQPPYFSTLSRRHVHSFGQAVDP